MPTLNSLKNATPITVDFDDLVSSGEQGGGLYRKIAYKYAPKTQDYVLNLTDEADFCINRCPHPDCECDGTCPEWEEFEKTLEPNDTDII